jgi:hypothetical protein
MIPEYTQDELKDHDEYEYLFLLFFIINYFVKASNLLLRFIIHIYFDCSYQIVLKAYNALKAQQERTKNDIANLQLQKEQALANPIEYIDKLFNQVTL